MEICCTTENYSPKQENDSSIKKRRFATFPALGHNHSHKRIATVPLRVLLVGKPKVGKSSVASMLINRDVRPGFNGDGIFVHYNTDITPPISPKLSTTPEQPFFNTHASSTILASDPPKRTTCKRVPNVHQSAKYVITDVDGFNEGSTDTIGTVLELRRWLEESKQGFHMVLVVLKAEEVAESDRRIFALFNALLHDMRDLIHLVVTGCEDNPHWIKEHERDLKLVYGTTKMVGVAFPSTSSGLLACIHEEMRKESLSVLEDYISRHVTSEVRIPMRGVGRSGSANSNKHKPDRMKAIRRSLSPTKFNE